MRHLASTESDRDLDLVPFFKELLNCLALEGEIVLVRSRTHPHFFEKGNLLILARVALFLFLLELESPIIQKATDRGNCRWGNFNEIGVVLLGESHRLVDG